MLDWAGYEVKALWEEYLKKYPGEKPKFTFMTNEANALAKLRAGFRPTSSVRSRLRQGLRGERLLPALDPTLITNFKHLNPAWSRRASSRGSSGDPVRLGLRRDPYRTDKVHPKAKSWSLLFDKRYSGKIAWYDDLNALVGRLLPRLQAAVQPDRRRAQAVPRSS